MTREAPPGDGAVLEDARMTAYMRLHLGVEMVVGAPAPATQNRAGHSESDSRAVEDATFAEYMRHHFPQG